MQISRWFFPLIIVLSAGSPAVLAHPGHGTTEPTSLTHVAEPVHLLPIVLAVLAISLIGVLSYRRFLKVREQQAPR